MSISQSGSFFNYTVQIKDYNTNPLFGGSSIHVFCNHMTADFNSIYGENTLPIGSQYYLTGTSESSGSAGIVRRNSIGYNSFTGFANALVVMDCSWATDVGSYYDDGASSVPILTPYKAVIMSMSGRRFYMTDERIIRQMMIEGNNNLYDGSGIPLVIKAVSINADKSSDNIVRFTVTMREDR